MTDSRLTGIKLFLFWIIALLLSAGIWFLLVIAIAFLTMTG